MADLDDVLEAAIDIEDIAEEVLEPDDLLADLVEHPLTVLLGLLAAAGVAFTLFMLLVLVALLLFESGLVILVAVVVAFGFVVTAVAVAAFLFVRTDVPHRVERRVDRARDRVDGSSRPGREPGMTEEAAIDRLRDLYAEGHLDERELEDGLEAVIAGDDPEAVVREYEREYEREHGRDRERTR